MSTKAARALSTINLEKPKQRYIRLLENALFGFGLSKLGFYTGLMYA
jgi:hypothetical protein